MPEPCPSCSSRDVRLSGRKHSPDEAQALLGNRPYRCRACGNRFYAQADPGGEAPAKRQRSRSNRDRTLRARWRHWRGTVLQAAVFLLVLAIFLFCLRYLANDHADNAPSSSVIPHPAPLVG